MRITRSELRKLAYSSPSVRLGCVVDTNALFAASVDLDRLTDWATDIFADLASIGIPAYTNINIRSEFLDLQRRVMIPEGLVSFFAMTNKETMNEGLKAKLHSLKTEKDRAGKESKLFKFSEKRIKDFRELFDSVQANTWELFCKDFLRPYIAKSWESTIADLKVQSVGTRAIDAREHFRRAPDWTEMTDIIGRFGIGSADAMIVNFFLCSKFPLIITGDKDVAYAVERLSDGTKYVVVPESAEGPPLGSGSSVLLVLGVQLVSPVTAGRGHHSTVPASHLFRPDPLGSPLSAGKP